ncbi:uncharacterized protein LOC124921304 [Impatiens glandulifera]|uniref:uncharacterized protein LOC124921304 n=1 Tax=Impatiens glandulifera TaxID=253017 RepID=UPI001FB112BF|nr:uncharacterized protein LOC124921304 [Impatiens glandulifera]
MGAAEFAMVEELASLIKDNLQCKHLILKMEESFINFIQEETSSDRQLELEPMNAYCRLLLHRLADIFGFSHYSLGEGNERHLVLQRCPETTIPSILVRDLLVQFDELEAPTVSHQLLRKSDDSSLSRTVAVTSDVQLSLEKREAAYMAARQRIFSQDEEKDVCEMQRPRNIPVVANRMIAHALGRRVKNSDSELRNSISKDAKTVSEGVDENVKIGKNDLKDDHVGAAKRLFANALGFRSGNKDRK